MVKFVSALYKAYDATDSSLFEINPVLKTSDDKIMAVDAKVNLDDNALFRHPEYAAMRDLAEEDPTEVEAGKSNLNYVKRSEEHTSELQSLMRISYAVFCLKKKNKQNKKTTAIIH